jgi:AraC family transcriptional regulator
MMLNKEVQKEYSKRINAVVNFILKNPTGELSLSKLAGIANYSPFHFQKIFKQVTGETPKQFIIRMRLENSAHFLITHRQKSITEIALDSGLASPTTFSRAFKNYFGISADELRNLSLKEHIAFRQSLNLKKNTDFHFLTEEHDPKYWTKNLKVTVNKITSIRAVFVNTPMLDKNKFQEGFRKIIQQADAHDLLTSETKFIGIINPHIRLYQAAVTLQSYQSPSKNMSTTEIEGGKFAVFKLTGDIRQTFQAFHAFYELWLPQSPYRIKQSYAFEILSKNPLTKPYSNIEREIYIPIEPA